MAMAKLSKSPYWKAVKTEASSKVCAAVFALPSMYDYDFMRLVITQLRSSLRSVFWFYDIEMVRARSPSASCWLFCLEALPHLTSSHILYNILYNILSLHPFRPFSGQVDDRMERSESRVRDPRTTKTIPVRPFYDKTIPFPFYSYYRVFFYKTVEVVLRSKVK